MSDTGLEPSVSKPRTKLYLAAALPLLAAALLAVRVFLQGGGGLYTADTVYYVADPVAGWTSAGSYFTVGWLLFGDPSGLNIFLFPLGVVGVGAVAIGVLAFAFVLQKVEKKKGKHYSWLHKLVWAGAASTLFFPVYAHLQSLPPDGARVEKPQLDAVDIAKGGSAAIEGLPNGRYEITESKTNEIVGSIKAGGDKFKAQFTKFSGHLQADFSNLSAPATVEFSAEAASVKTGNSMRDGHAVEQFHAKEFPQITFTLGAVQSRANVTPQEVAIEAKGTITLTGKEVPVEVRARVKKLDDAAKTHLGVPTASASILLQADFTLSIKGTKVDDGETFDTTDIPVSVSLVLQKASN